ncbi:hypothetical protein K437DRAFT_259315 [Tilletiaria anomala UBC 951]|uniref:TFG box profile domain-containing protein n=1 Tax=Tilletiaria anomala (strain ATCC 24038 / CBS 436.72 / UBC 951) TaxID=1037660 RepID=A0A066VEH3_TILAU|nr:uncharacterized protein K437DRAFT_259315 [Tilletiaria anomala UBC 951]KDN38708.1 hypothetical protein K437DRAFT_259315 [Tilletiaria anomala UBC 951]
MSAQGAVPTTGQAQSGASPAAAGPAQFIGALISLISKSDIRYQGILAQIDPAAATISLEQVKSFGTEGRLASQGRHSEEIPPAYDNVYEYVVFRAGDVKDLKIDDPNPQRSQPPPPPQQMQDPAILGARGPSGPPQGPPGPGGPGGMYGMPPPPPFGPPGGYGSPWGAPGPGSPFGPLPPPPHHMQPPPPHHRQQPQQQQQQHQEVRPSQEQAKASPAPPVAPVVPATPAIATGPQAQAKPPTADVPVEASPAVRASPPEQAPAPPLAAKAAQKNISIEDESARADGAAAADALVSELAGLAVTPQRDQTSATVMTNATGRKAATGVGAQHNLPPRPAVPHHADNSGEHQPRRRREGGGNRGQRGPRHDGIALPADASGADFDFESANAKFAKEKDALAHGGDAEANAPNGSGTLDAIPAPVAEPKSFYDKSGFFDDISSEIKERHETFNGNNNPRQNRFAEQQKNMATFGESGTSHGHGGRGGRGRGRGGRGGGRGGRGGRGTARGRGGATHHGDAVDPTLGF